MTFAKNSSFYNNLLYSSIALANIVHIITIYLINIVMLGMPTYYVLIMQNGVDLMNIVLVLILISSFNIPFFYYLHALLLYCTVHVQLTLILLWPLW